MREGLVGLGHLVGVLTLLDGGAGVVAGVHDLAGEALFHGLFAALAGIAGEPAEAEGLTAGGTDLNGDLVGGTADTAGLDLEGRHDVVEGLGESLKRLFTGLLLDDVESVVHDFLSDAFLSVQHNAVDELGDHHRVVYRIGEYLSLGNVTSSGHYTSLLHIKMISQVLVVFHVLRRGMYPPPAPQLCGTAMQHMIPPCAPR